MGLRQLANTVLWKYADDVPAETLYWHHRIARIAIRVWLASSLLMCSCIFEFLVSTPGWVRDLFMIGMIITVSISLLGLFPFVFFFFWAEEIERTLRARGVSHPNSGALSRYVGISAMKMCLWVGLMMLAVHLMR